MFHNYETEKITRKAIQWRGRKPATSCRWAATTICLHSLQVDNNFVFFHQVAPVLARWLFKTSATSWLLTFWPWKWCPSHVLPGLPLCQF